MKPLKIWLFGSQILKILIKIKSIKYNNKRWEGENGLIIPKDPWFVRGHRLVMTSNEAYVGFSSLKAFRKEWTV